MIKNADSLARHDPQARAALDVLEAGLQAARPEAFVRRALSGRRRAALLRRRLYTVAYGKASWAMARQASKMLPVRGGMAVIGPGSAAGPIPRTCLLRSSHPVPTARSVRAARQVSAFLSLRRAGDHVLFLVSGGGSAMMALPAPGMSLKDKAEATRVMLSSGADISAVNCIRRHLSAIKGGRLVSGLKCTASAILMSDVAGDSPSDISSGCTAPDKTTFAQALAIAKRYGMAESLPKSAMARLEAGAAKRIPEGPARTRVLHYPAATAAACIDAMERQAGRSGLRCSRMRISGDVRDAAKRIAARMPARPGSCLLFSGETTVQPAPGGRGGRNQELVMRAMMLCKKRRLPYTICSAGTDGIDGSTKSAGAVASSPGPHRIGEMRSYLRTSDSGLYFARRGGAIRTGPTGSNLADIGLAITW